MENIVRIEHLSHRYNIQWAIRDINLEINERGVVGLLGSNGAGKSTTMNIICGVLKQTEGDVYIDGINFKDNSIEAKKRIGFLPQTPPLYMDFTINEYLTYCADLRMVDKTNVKEAVNKAMERCGITHFKNRLLRNLSGGYRQRVGIAQAIVHNPKFVVLDEPTNGLDPNQILEVRHLIKEIAEEKAILLSTHILSEVQATCSEIRMIEHGQLVFSGTVEEFDNYIKPNTLVISLNNPPTEESLKLKGINRIEKITENQFRLTYDGERETVRSVAEQCVLRGWELEELNIEKSSMDEVFAKLSGKK